LHLHSTIAPSLPKLVEDYFNGIDSLRSFYARNPTLDGVIKAAKERSAFPIDRNALVNELKLQSAKSSYASKETQRQIDRLLSEDVFTITTGHQLCVYGGPMFFIYKIISAIKACEMLQEEGVQAVPVYWMASEDHDFEEINHIFYNTQKATWDIAAKGPVGRLKLNGLEGFKQQLSSVMGNYPMKLDALRKMDEIFHVSKTLAEAIRDFVYWLFADRGVIVIDADSVPLKRLFSDVVRQELQSSTSFNAVNASTQQLVDLGYGGQVTPREINLFWMQDGYRERIEKTASGFQTVDGQHAWSADELFQQLDRHPECFSPNVVLRPVYQEVLLPNLAYIGGLGELSYWLQLKRVFDAYNVFFPAILLRDMAIILSEKTLKRLGQLDISVEDVHSPFDELFNTLVRREGSHEHLVDDKASEIGRMLSALTDSIGEFDPSLERSAETERARILKRLNVLQKKVMRSDRRNNEVIERQLKEVYTDIRPHNTPQERIENFLRFTNEQQRLAFVTSLLSKFDPFERKVKVFS